MANYTINFSCGHEGEVQLFCKGAERQQKINYLEKRGECNECYKKRIEQEKIKKAEQEENKQNCTTALVEAGVPLTHTETLIEGGSEKLKKQSNGIPADKKAFFENVVSVLEKFNF